MHVFGVLWCKFMLEIEVYLTFFDGFIILLVNSFHEVNDMLTDERRSQILKIVEEKGSVSVQALMDALHASESTIRRDLNDLDKKGFLTKVHGGALMIGGNVLTVDAPTEEREVLNQETKRKIAIYAASMIKDDDIIYLDAGTTTGMMIEFIHNTRATFMTNAVTHARKLSAKGLQVLVPCGLLKSRTDALVGADTCQYLENFNFTKGFFGANGVTIREGFTTPDRQEATVKKTALSRCKEKYILCDGSKFDQISAVKICDFVKATCVTDESVPSIYKLQDTVLITE